MNDLTRGERLQIMLTPEELEALDNWRFQRRMPSRAAAVRELLKRGLAAEGFDHGRGRQQIPGFRRHRRIHAIAHPRPARRQQRRRNSRLPACARPVPL